MQIFRFLLLNIYISIYIYIYILEYRQAKLIIYHSRHLTLDTGKNEMLFRQKLSDDSFVIF